MRRLYGLDGGEDQCDSKLSRSQPHPAPAGQSLAAADRQSTDAAQIGDEFIFITELSAKLAERFQRPLSSIAVHISHSQCIFFAGTFEPAYTATVSALGPYVQPATNRRNAYVLSEHLEEALGVPSPRGLINFVALSEDNVASDGRTMAQTLDEAVNTGLSQAMGVIEEERVTSVGSRKKRLSVKVSRDSACIFFRRADAATVALEHKDDDECASCRASRRIDAPHKCRGHFEW